MLRKERKYVGSVNQQVSKRENRNRVIARNAAAEGIVLLENDGVLPLQSNERVVLMGSGATQTIKGGTGSGDVNERDVVNIYTGMKNAGFIITNQEWIEEYNREYAEAKEQWRNKVLKAIEGKRNVPHALIDEYVATKFETPLGRNLTQKEVDEADTDIVVYVLSRNAGEAADRLEKPGDYYVTEEEKQQMIELTQCFSKMILVLNCGGPVDLGFLDEVQICALVQLSQPGQEGGNAFADIITGKVTPSGKMTDTWACRYEDYPNADTFSHNNGNVEQELYKEGIYVGYRYFDTFQVKPRIPFGFGLSYTDFTIKAMQTSLKETKEAEWEVCVQVEVTNIGKNYAGKEVVQIYTSCPQGKLRKEYQRLCAFGKTPLLQPGEKCVLQISFPIMQLTSFDEEESSYVMEKGSYLVSVGNSSVSNEVCAKLDLDESVSLLVVDAICPLQQPLMEMEPGIVPEKEYGDISILSLKAEDISSYTVVYSDVTPEKNDGKAGELVESLSVEQLLALTSGDPGKGQDAFDTAETFGSSGLSVPGAAGETHSCASKEPWNLASIVLADGPAGLRLCPRYTVRPDGSIVKQSFADTIEHGIFASEEEISGATYYYQYCTAIPVGTMLAQSWNMELMEQIGSAVAEEMEEFGVTLWLAPGMNIHRNPLCGRNFEYYSEDPLLSGVMAAAITLGVQSKKGVGTTIKHLACNNQEDNRKNSDSIVSERALREIYLHGFEIAVKHSQPMSIMTSYNLLNGVHTANSYDLITKAARDEWGFKGVVMTDWTTTGIGGSSPVECMKAGNDLIMPGSHQDIEILQKALEGSNNETLDIREVKKCVLHLVDIILQSNEYEDCESYLTQFKGMKPYIQSRIV